MNPVSTRRVFAVALMALGACQPPPSEGDESDLDNAPGAYESVASELAVNGPTGTMTAQYADSPAGEDATKLMDGQAATKWLTFHNASWVRWKGASALKASSYALTSANDTPGRDPKSWTLYGSSDGTTWHQLDARTGQTFASRALKKSYTIATPTLYQHYRLKITAAADSTLNTLQLAEWDLGCVPTSITPYLRVDGGSWQQTAAATVNAGSSVKLGPQPTTGGSWSWTGPSGFKATTREVTIGNIGALQAGSYVATYTNSGGCKSKKSFTITLAATAPPPPPPPPPITADWSTFVYPTVVFTDEAVGLEGSTIFHDAILKPEEMMKEQILAVVKELYFDNLDPRVNFTKLNLKLVNEPDSVAWKSGAPPEITIGVSAQYVASFFHNNNSDLNLVNKEVRGILSHEGTHGYQWTPKNCGAYDGSSVFWAFIEGEADGVRAELTNWTPPRSPSKGGTWNGGYTRTGFFLSWCKQHKKPTFIIELNHAAHDLDTFTWELAFQRILGQSVQQVWDEYQATLP